MYYDDLKNELEFIQSEGESNLSKISQLSSYYRLVYSYYSSQSSSIDETFKDKISTETDNTNSPNNISALFTSFQQMTAKTRKILNKFSQDIITPLDAFYKSQSQIYNDININFKSLLENILKAQSSLDNSKFIYYNSCYISNQKGNESNSRMKLIQKNNEQLYQYEYAYYDNVINKANGEYEKIINNLKQNEESRIYFIKFTIDQYTKLISEYENIIQKMISVINELFTTKNCEDEFHSINKKHDANNSDRKGNGRIRKEKYTSFNDYVELTKKESNTQFNFEIITSSESIDAQKLNETIAKVKYQLLSNEEIDIGQLTLLTKFLRSNLNETGNLFLNSFQDMEWYRCPNYSNFNYLLTIIMFIVNNINEGKTSNGGKQKNELNDGQCLLVLERYNINQKIITLAQKVYYQQPVTKSKIYLSTLLSKQDPMYQSKSFWREMFNVSVAEILNNYLNSISKTTSKGENDIESSQTPHKNKARKLISYASNSVSSSILSRIWTNTDIKYKGFVYKNKISSFIPNYQKLTTNDINALEEIAINEVKRDSFLKVFFTNMSYFNFPIEKTIDLLTELGEEMKLSKDLINYYVSICNVNWYTIKRVLLNNEQANNYLQSYRLSAKERRIKLIIFALDYLNWKDYFVLLQLSKVSHKKLSNKISKKALMRKNLPIATRVKIWHSILKINKIKKSYSYSALIDKATNKLDQKTITQIQVDIPRTFIPSSIDKTKARDAIYHILLAISQVCGDGKYCQGMNFIAQFLYEITGDEEQAFNIFLGIFKSTEYSLIFGQDLLKFKMIFYVFHRLLSLYEPEINSIFAIHKFEVYYFLAPCFYTLFQNIREGIQEKGLPLILLRILDGFFTSGLKCIMKVGLNLLHHTSNVLLAMKNDEMNEYLTKTIFTIDLFENSQIEKFENLQKKKISKKLIEYIEQEYIQNISIKESENNNEII